MNPKAVMFLAAGVLVLASLFILLKPDSTAPEIRADAATTGTAGSPDSTTPASLLIELAVRERRRISGPEVIRAVRGQPITLRITSDQADELHLHGYNLRAELRPNEPAVLSFTATLTGRFEYELHKTHVALGVLEVQPNP